MHHSDGTIEFQLDFELQGTAVIIYIQRKKTS